MRIPVSSNIISGIYVIVELLIAVSLSHFITIIIQCQNVREIHDLKRKVQLTINPLQIFLNVGLAAKKTHMLSAIAFSIVVILTTVGSFSITGVTADKVETITVKNLVKKATADEYIDFSRHISIEAGLVSGTVASIQRLEACARTTRRIKSIYQFSNEIDDIDSLQWPVLPRNDPVRCHIPEAGFRHGVALQHSYLNGSEIKNESRCTYSINPSTVPVKNITRTAVQIRNCPVEELETWCYKNNGLYCASFVNYSGAYTTALAFASPFRSGTIFTTARLHEAVPSTVLKSMTLLLAIGMGTNPTYLYSMATLSVEKNASVERVIGDKPETEVNVTLICGTLGVAVLITLIAGVVAASAWLIVLVLPGRLEYNRFNTAVDLLSYASYAALSEGRSSFHRNETVAIGISKAEPHVGPLRKLDEIGEHIFPEEELYGRSTLSLRANNFGASSS